MNDDSLNYLILQVYEILNKINSYLQEMLRLSTDFIRFSLTMAYGIGRNIAFLECKINQAFFSEIGIIQNIYELC